MNETQIRISAIDQTRKAFESVKGSLSSLKDRVFSVQGAIAGIIGGATVKSIVDANRSFQSLQASLITFTGSTEAANAQFAVLQQFAKTTPFALEEVVSGFNKLVARGMQPTIESFEAFGNIAAGTGKSLDQFIEAVADAVTGEFERLKEFGVKASKEGETVKFTFGGMTTAVANNATAIEGYLRQLSETKFGGAMARQADTLNGAISNLEDAFFQLSTAIGKSGLNDLLVKIVRSLTEATNKFTLFFGSMDERKLAVVNEELAKVEKFLNMGPIQRKLFTFLSEDELKAEKARLESLRTTYEDAVKVELPAPKISPVAPETKKDLAEITTLMEAAKLKIREMDEAFALEEAPELISFFDKLKERIEQFDYENIKGGKTALEEYALAARNLGSQLDNVAVRSLRGLEDALVGVFMGTMTVKDAFKSMAASIISDLIRIYIQRTITGPIADAIFGPLQTAGVSARAMGGPVSVNRPYMVGERGPELFVPHSSGSIVSNNRLSGGGGGSTNNIVVNVNMENGSVNATDGNRLGVLVGNIVKGELVKQTRPGGLLAA
jgi:hypothetical protein